MSSYIKGLFHGLGSLLTGLGVTGREFFTRKVTEQYPENRATLKMFDRFCGELTMPHDAEGNNKCIACGLCQSACPNDTILVLSEMVEDPETGKSKRKLVLHRYDLGSCMFCHLCVNVCPTDAIRFSTDFEHAVYTREKLVKKLNINKQ
ncbi:4Fe-4S binding protein [uncultured Alistipes sp.]|jgi:hypothetical protein|uniref:4Fe-4S binding protein n=1 Tax=uncultured Alistipes sp. TaxID=538949 RepID=UPI0025D4CBFE|nr:4Fe-4S binding protein [uncultured Alistipes sp.]